MTTPPWSTLGVTLQDTDDVLPAAGLDGWHLRKAPLYAADPDTGETIPTPGRYCVLRDTPLGTEAVGVVGDRYHVMTMEALAALSAGLQLPARYAGELSGGRGAFITLEHSHMEAPEVTLYLSLITYHDGSAPLTAVLTAVGQGGVPVGYRSVRYLHTPGRDERATPEGILSALDPDTLRGYVTRFSEELLDRSEARQRVVDRYPPGGPTQTALTLAERRQDRILTIYRDDPYAGTRLGLIRAEAAYRLWEAPLRGRSMAGEAEERARRSLVGSD